MPSFSIRKRCNVSDIATNKPAIIAATDNTPVGRLMPWIVVFTAALFFFFEFMQVNMFNALGPYLFRAYHLKDSVQLGHLSANYMYANVLLLFPAGVILDRVSIKRIIVFTMFLCITCTLAFSFTTQLWQGELCRFVTGLGGAFCLLSCVRLATRWFPPRQMALVAGLIVTFAMTGALIAQKPFTQFAADYGWRHTLLVDSLAGYVMLFLIMIIVKDYPAGKQRMFEAQQSQLQVFRSVMLALRNKQNWLAGIYASLINIPVFILGTWGGMYLHQVYHMSAGSAAGVTSMLFLGLILGSPLFGWISDKLSVRRMPMIVGALICLALVFAIMYWPHASYAALMTLFFLFGLAVSSQIISYAVVAEANPEPLIGAGEGVASFLIMAGGFLIPVFSRLLDIDWHHHFVQGVPYFSLKAYHLAFWLMPIGFIIALFAAIAMSETHCRSFSERNS